MRYKMVVLVLGYALIIFALHKQSVKIKTCFLSRRVNTQGYMMCKKLELLAFFYVYKSSGILCCQHGLHLQQ